MKIVRNIRKIVVLTSLFGLLAGCATEQEYSAAERYGLVRQMGGNQISQQRANAQLINQGRNEPRIIGRVDFVSAKEGDRIYNIKEKIITAVCSDCGDYDGDGSISFLEEFKSKSGRYSVNDPVVVAVVGHERNTYLSYELYRSRELIKAKHLKDVGEICGGVEYRFNPGELQIGSYKLIGYKDNVDGGKRVVGEVKFEVTP